MFVAWKISDALLEVLYKTIDNSVMQATGSVKNLLVVLKSIVGFIGFDLVSFLIAVIILVFAQIHSNEE
jgi:uncharacterized membrane protein required for colicin V production